MDWKYIIGNVNVYRDVYRAPPPTMVVLTCTGLPQQNYTRWLADAPKVREPFA